MQISQYKNTIITQLNQYCGDLSCFFPFFFLYHNNWSTTHRTLKQMGSSSRRPHRVPLLSAKNRTQRLQFTQARQNWTIEDWKNVAWSDESWFLLKHSDGGVRIWRKEHESMDPSCLVSTNSISVNDFYLIQKNWHGEFKMSYFCLNIFVPFSKKR